MESADRGLPRLTRRQGISFPETEPSSFGNPQSSENPVDQGQGTEDRLTDFFGPGSIRVQGKPAFVVEVGSPAADESNASVQNERHTPVERQHDGISTRRSRVVESEETRVTDHPLDWVYDTPNIVTRPDVVREADDKEPSVSALKRVTSVTLEKGSALDKAALRAGKTVTHKLGAFVSEFHVPVPVIPRIGSRSDKVTDIDIHNNEMENDMASTEQITEQTSTEHVEQPEPLTQDSDRESVIETSEQGQALSELEVYQPVVKSAPSVMRPIKRIKHLKVEKSHGEALQMEENWLDKIQRGKTEAEKINKENESFADVKPYEMDSLRTGAFTSAKLEVLQSFPNAILRSSAAPIVGNEAGVLSASAFVSGAPEVEKEILEGPYLPPKVRQKKINDNLEALGASTVRSAVEQLIPDMDPDKAVENVVKALNVIPEDEKDPPAKIEVTYHSTKGTFVSAMPTAILVEFQTGQGGRVVGRQDTFKTVQRPNCPPQDTFETSVGQVQDVDDPRISYLYALEPGVMPMPSTFESDVDQKDFGELRIRAVALYAQHFALRTAEALNSPSKTHTDVIGDAGARVEEDRRTRINLPGAVRWMADKSALGLNVDMGDGSAIQQAISYRSEIKVIESN